MADGPSPGHLPRRRAVRLSETIPPSAGLRPGRGAPLTNVSASRTAARLPRRGSWAPREAAARRDAPHAGALLTNHTPHNGELTHTPDDLRIPGRLLTERHHLAVCRRTVGQCATRAVRLTAVWCCGRSAPPQGRRSPRAEPTRCRPPAPPPTTATVPGAPGPPPHRRPTPRRPLASLDDAVRTGTAPPLCGPAHDHRPQPRPDTASRPRAVAHIP